MLVIVLRGALDGLAAVAPVGDPDWVKLRGDKALALDGKTPGAAARYRSSRSIRRCRICIGSTRPDRRPSSTPRATPYRERSHFDGQDVLESGAGKVGADRHRLA